MSSHRNEGSYLNGTSLWINEFLALGHVPYDLQAMELLRVTKIDRIVLQRAPCDHPTLCLGLNPWTSWFEGFYRSMILAFQPEVRVFRRDFGNETEWRAERFVANASSLLDAPIHIHSRMCFDRVIRRHSMDSFASGISKSTTVLFRRKAYSISNVSSFENLFNRSVNSTEGTSSACTVISVTHRGTGTSRHIDNYGAIVDMLKQNFSAVLVDGRAPLGTDLCTCDKARVVVRLVDTSNTTQLSSFQSQVRLAAESHVLVGEHGAFHTNLVFMRQGGLFIDLRGDYLNAATETFERLADLFDVNYKHVVTKAMTSHVQSSFVIGPDEVEAVGRIITSYLTDFLGLHLAPTPPDPDSQSVQANTSSLDETAAAASAPAGAAKIYTFPEVYQNKKCLITTKSQDGFGHQVRASS